jgi:hypothetical protein
VVGINVFIINLPTHENTRVCLVQFADEAILGFSVSSDECFNAGLDDQLLPATEKYLATLELDESLIKDEMESENDDKADREKEQRILDIDAIAANLSQRQRVLAKTYNDIMSEKRPQRESRSLR